MPSQADVFRTDDVEILVRIEPRAARRCGQRWSDAIDQRRFVAAGDAGCDDVLRAVGTAERDMDGVAGAKLTAAVEHVERAHGCSALAQGAPCGIAEINRSARNHLSD